ncbi:hypothetical protein TNCV_2976211 [Trichonephila clavipes]|nr:hypothetical protein TNCV_2976211 [Trichonephila clavipes]
MVKVKDNWPARLEFEPSTTPLKSRRVRGRCTLNLSKLKLLPVGVVWKLEEGVPAQVSFSSLDHRSKLRGPSPRTLEWLGSATLIFTHSLAHSTSSD